MTYRGFRGLLLRQWLAIALLIGLLGGDAASAWPGGEYATASAPPARPAGAAGEWTLRFAPEEEAGTMAPGSPTNVVVSRRADRTYVVTEAGKVLAFDRRHLQPMETARVAHHVTATALDDQAGRLYLAGTDWTTNSARLTILRTPDLAVVREIVLAPEAWVLQTAFDARRGTLHAVVMRSNRPGITWELLALDVDGRPRREPTVLPLFPMALALDTETGQVLLAARYEDTGDTVLAAYRSDGTVAKETALPLAPVTMTRYSMVLDEARRRVYVAGASGGAADALVALDADSLAVVKVAEVGRQPVGAVLDAARGQVWISTLADDPTGRRLWEVIDPATGRLLGKMELDRPLPAMAKGFAAIDGDTRRLWLANNDHSVSVVSLDERALVRSIPTGDRLEAVVVDESTGRVFVASASADLLYVAQSSDGSIVARLPVGREPVSLRIDQSTGRVAVLNKTGRTVTMVDGRALHSVANISIEEAPRPHAWDVDWSIGRMYLWREGELVGVSLDDGREVGRLRIDRIGGADAAVAVDPSTHLVYVTGYASAIVDGTTLRDLGALPGTPVRLLIDTHHRRAYAAHWCTVKSCGERTFVYDLSDHSLLAQLEGVARVRAINHHLGHLYGAEHPVQMTDAFTFEPRLTDWQATEMAADSRRGKVYLLHRHDGYLRAVVDPYPTSAAAIQNPFWAKIQIVWPHGGAPVTEAEKANIGATVFRPGSFRPIDCGFAGSVRLWRAVNNGPAEPVAHGVQRVVAYPGHQAQPWTSAAYPSWEFNDVDVAVARDPRDRIFFFLVVDDLPVATNVWSHAADARTYFPRQDVPAGTAPAGDAVETRIQIVWPHDGHGTARPVSEAVAANVGVQIWSRGSGRSVPEDWDPVVRLYRSLNNGPEELVGIGRKEAVVQGDLRWPQWVFYDVDVSAATNPNNRYYFRALVDGVDNYPNVWSHGVDGRTSFPRQDIPIGPCR